MEKGLEKPKEFEKLLSGERPHSLSKGDVEAMLRKCNGLIPHDLLRRVLQLKIDAWRLDVAGRRDFQHHFNVRIRQWLMKTETKWKHLSPADKTRAQQETKTKLVKEKAAS